MKNADTAEIGEALARHAEVVDGEAYACRNLAGTSKRRFRMAALAVRAGVNVLRKRAQDPSASTDQRMDVLRAKVRRIEESARKKDEEVAKLRKQLKELHNFKATMATGMSPEEFQRAISRSPQDSKTAAIFAPVGERMDVDEGPNITLVPVPAPATPGWLPSSKKEFEACLERTVLGHLSFYLDKWVRDDWEPRVVRLLRETREVPPPQALLGPPAPPTTAETPVMRERKPVALRVVRVETLATPVRVMNTPTATMDVEGQRNRILRSGRRKKRKMASPSALAASTTAPPKEWIPDTGLR